MFTIIVRTVKGFRSVIDSLDGRRYDAKLAEGGNAVVFRVFDN